MGIDVGFLVSPLSEGGERQTYSLSIHDFIQYNGKKDRTQSYPYTLIGFDTEYQTDNLDLEYESLDPEEQREFEERHKERLIKGELQYEVLSYQFYVSIVHPPNHKDYRKEPVSWEGVFLPESGDREDRKSFKEFIEFALSSGKDLIREHRIRIPPDIYLIGHFTRADVSAFDDFVDEDKRKQLNLSNIRNTFSTLGRKLKFSLDYVEKEDRVKQERLKKYEVKNSNEKKNNHELIVDIDMRDTMLLAPQTVRKLEDLGEVVKVQKLQLGGNEESHKHHIANMKEYRDINWEEFRSYGLRDAEICVKYAYEIMKLNHKQTGRFNIPVTLTSMGITLLEEKWKKDGYSRLDLVGKELKEDGKFNKRLNQFRTRKREVFKDRVFWRLDFVTESYHGGRNEQFMFGVSDEDNWVDWDLTSAYPSAMNIIGIPDWDGIRHLSTNEELFELSPEDLAFASVDFKFPEHIKYPVLPERTMNGIIFPLEGRSLCGIPEILLAKELGAEINIVEGCVVPTDRERYRIFDNFIRDCVEQRNQYEKGSLDNLFWKELSNSTYGKTAQGLRERRVFDLKEEETVRLEESQLTNPFFASYITSFVRGVLGEIMNNLPSTTKVISVTTDGFLTNASNEEIREAAKGKLSEIFLQSRKRMVGDEAEILEIKHKAKQVLGWRTRGQATLKPYDNDWNNKDNFVLQRGGISIRDAFSRQTDNDDVIYRFFGRDGQKKFNVQTGLGVKEQWVYGNDFVHKILTRSLSMEYDFKRRPIEQEDKEVEFKGEKVKHLYFETTPWKSVEEFMKVRSLLSVYNNKNKHCFKTVDDYQNFRIWFNQQIKRDDPSSGKGWLPQEPDLFLLRQALFSAFDRRKAGFEVIEYDKGDGKGKRLLRVDGKDQVGTGTKLKTVEWVELLNREIVLDKILTNKDFDNGRKKDFTPKSVPRSKRVVEKLEKLKEIAIPKLDIEEILDNDEQIII